MRTERRVACSWIGPPSVLEPSRGFTVAADLARHHRSPPGTASCSGGGASLAAQARLSVCLPFDTWGNRDAGGLVHDMPDRTRATPTRRDTAQVTKELTSGARRRAGCHRGSHVVVAQHVAGANDHDSSSRTCRRPRRISAECGSSNTRCHPRDPSPRYWPRRPGACLLRSVGTLTEVEVLRCGACPTTDGGVPASRGYTVLSSRTGSPSGVGMSTATQQLVDMCRRLVRQGGSSGRCSRRGVPP